MTDTDGKQIAALGRLVEDAQRKVAALAGELDRRINAQVTDLADLKRDLGAATRVAKKSLELVTTIAEQVAHAQGGGDDQTPRRPVNILIPDDPDAVGSALAELRGWIQDVYLRYEGGSPTDQTPAPALSDCWLWHPGAVAELHACYRMWVTAYLAPRPSDGAVADWHDRYRPGTVRRVNASLDGCHMGKHERATDYRRPAAGAADEMMSELLDWYTDGNAGRDVPPAPNPGMLAASRARRDATAR